MAFFFSSLFFTWSGHFKKQPMDKIYKAYFGTLQLAQNHPSTATSVVIH